MPDLETVYLKSLIIHEKTHRKSVPCWWFGYRRKRLHKLSQISPQFSLKILTCLRYYIKHSEECFMRISKYLEVVKKLGLPGLVFQHTSQGLDILMKHSSSCLIYYINFISSGFTERLNYIQPDQQRKRRNVQTNIGRHFLQLVDKHFPNGHVPYKIYNRGNCKVSYSWITWLLS